MPGRKAKPPRLYLRERGGRGDVWVVLDRGNEISTGCGPDDVKGAEKFLAAYIGQKHRSTVGSRHPASLKIADILTFYTQQKTPDPNDSRKVKSFETTLGNVNKLLEFWGVKTLAMVKGSSCREYVTWRTAQKLFHAKRGKALKKRVSAGMARRELETLRAAINFYHAEHTLDAVPKVTLPEKSAPRERWLTRTEAARLLGAALGFVWDVERETWKTEPPLPGENLRRLVRRDWLTRSRRRHIARFILVGLYTGTRHEAIQRLQWHPNPSGGWFDLDRGLIYRRGIGERETKKRRPPARVVHRLLPHLHRWARMDRDLSTVLTAKSGETVHVLHVVHTTSGAGLSTPIRTGWEGCLEDAGLGSEVIPHTLRHTAATWQMQAGTDFWEASGMLGMTVETLQNVYGHHHPDFQDNAAKAFTGRMA